MHVHLPKPLHGWREFLGEVGIIVVGVLIALAAEQVVEALRWKREAHHSMEAIGAEVADHYFAGSEAMISQPCIDRQLALLEERLTRPGPYEPAPLYSERAEDYTFRAPDRIWSDDVWRGAVSGGVASHLNSELRLTLAAYYSQVAIARMNNQATELLVFRLRTLGRPLQLDSTSRVALVEEVEEARGRFREASLISSQLLRRAETLSMQPPREYVQQGLQQSGTINFCRAHGLPLGDNKAVL